MGWMNVCCQGVKKLSVERWLGMVQQGLELKCWCWIYVFGMLAKLEAGFLKEYDAEKKEEGITWILRSS